MSVGSELDEVVAKIVELQSIYPFYFDLSPTVANIPGLPVTIGRWEVRIEHRPNPFKFKAMLVRGNTLEEILLSVKQVAESFTQDFVLKNLSA